MSAEESQTADELTFQPLSVNLVDTTHISKEIKTEQDNYLVNERALQAVTKYEISFDEDNANTFSLKTAVVQVEEGLSVDGIVNETEKALQGDKLDIHNQLSREIKLEKCNDNYEESNTFDEPSSSICSKQAQDFPNADSDIIDLTDETVEIVSDVRFSSKKKKKKKKHKHKEKEKDKEIRLPKDDSNLKRFVAYEKDDCIIIENIFFKPDPVSAKKQLRIKKTKKSPKETEEFYDAKISNSSTLKKERPKRKASTPIYEEDNLLESDENELKREIISDSKDIVRDENEEVLLPKFKCDVCGKCYTKEWILKQHMSRWHMKKKSLYCNMCHLKFENFASLARHKRDNHDRSYLVKKRDKVVSSGGVMNIFTCDHCNATFRIISALRKHLVAHRAEKPTQTFACPEQGCNEVFQSLLLYRRHARSHNQSQPYPCPQCGRRFSLWPNMMRHMRLHAGLKPYKCRFCPLTFSDQAALVSHERHIHTKEKPYICEICAKAWATKSDLNRHMLLHTNEKKYECPECGKRFKQRQALITHLRCKNKEKSWVCGVCGKAFAQKGGLRTHMAVHSEYKLYKCEVCDKEFTHHASFRAHKVVHSGELKYSCQYCGRKFSFPSNKNRHERTVHADRLPWKWTKDDANDDIDIE